MFILNITDDYNDFDNCTDNKNDHVNIIIECLLLSIPANILLFSLVGLVIYTMIKPVIKNK